MTNGHAASPHDPEASLRADLSAKIAGAQSDIESKLTELRNALASAQNGLAVTQADSQLRGLSTLQRRISLADANGLSAIRSEVAASIAVTQAFMQQAQAWASASQSAQIALSQANEAACGSVNDFMHGYYDEHKFDPYLRFASAQDEEQYRKREEERKQTIEKALAEHTPEGTLRANQLAIEQLKDAGAHGADRSSDYQPTLRSLESSRDSLSAHMSAAAAETSKQQRYDTANAPIAPDALAADASAAEAIARFRAQVSVADQDQQGHGISTAKPAVITPNLPSH